MTRIKRSSTTNWRKTKNTKDALKIGWVNNKIIQSEVNIIVGWKSKNWSNKTEIFMQNLMNSSQWIELMRFGDEILNSCISVVAFNYILKPIWFLLILFTI